MLNVFVPEPVDPTRGTGVGAGGEWPSISLSLHVEPNRRVAYIEWPFDEPMVNVIALVQSAERCSAQGEWAVVFDLADEGLYETLVGGYRLHGMYQADILREE